MTSEIHLEVDGVAEKAPRIPSPDPIAIVGLAGRFPGEATSARKLWDMCCEGRSAWSEVRKDRFNEEAYIHPNPSKNGCVRQNPPLRLGFD